MHKLTLTAAAALFAGTIAAPAMAQTMVGDRTLTDEEYRAALTHCTSLKAIAEGGNDTVGTAAGMSGGSGAAAPAPAGTSAMGSAASSAGHDATDAAPVANQPATAVGTSMAGSEVAADDGAADQAGDDVLDEGAGDGPASFDVTSMTVEQCAAAGLMDSQ